MNQLQQQRLYLVILLMLGLTLAAGLILYALKQNMNVFLTPQQLAAQTLPDDYRIRLGGLVKPHSLSREQKNLSVTFVVTDLKKDIIVHYQGILPDLFREGKGVIADGYLAKDGSFIATQVLAKHDENYMPKKVYQSLRKNTA